MYRVYNEGLGRHHLTQSLEEYGQLPSMGWNQEGIKLYSIVDNEPEIPDTPSEAIVNVTGISLNPTSLNLTVGQTEKNYHNNNSGKCNK